MAVIVVKAVKPKKLRADVFRLEILTGMRDVERAMVKEFEKTTDTWEGDKPTFKAIRSLRGGALTLIVGPGGDKKGAQKWQWLDEGTKVRYATMSADWISKTRPNIVGSRSGRGKVLFVNKSRPRPGIKARNWTKIIQKQFTPRFKRRMEKAMREAVKKSGHGVR